MSEKTVLEKLMEDDVALDIYLSDTNTSDFKADVIELMQAYSDSGVVDRAIELLERCRTKNP